MPHISCHSYWPSIWQFVSSLFNVSLTFNLHLIDVWLGDAQMVPGGGVGDYGMLDTDPVFSQIIDNAKQMSK